MKREVQPSYREGRFTRAQARAAARKAKQKREPDAG